MACCLQLAYCTTRRSATGRWREPAARWWGRYSKCGHLDCPARRRLVRLRVATAHPAAHLTIGLGNREHPGPAVGDRGRREWMRRVRMLPATGIPWAMTRGLRIMQLPVAAEGRRRRWGGE